ncbi:MAG: glucose-6-phosphate isomerase family protein [Candidatus Saccharibacteria bacterium]
MIDLEKVSGLPLKLAEDGRLVFGTAKVFSPKTGGFKEEQLPEVAPNIRKYQDMTPVLMDRSAQPGQEDMYYMYRDVHFPEDEEAIRKSHVTYDITVIPPVMTGREFNKTVGHYHAVKSGTGLAYPEVYEVLHGHCLFLLQKMDAEFRELITILAIEARAGEKVVYPPNYGHVIVNLGKDILVTANWVGDGFERMYKPVADMRGMAYYVVEADNEKGYELVPNKSYKNVPEVRMITGKFMDNLAIAGSKPMYSIGTGNPESLEFLNQPEKYAVELSSITS